MLADFLFNSVKDGQALSNAHARASELGIEDTFVKHLAGKHDQSTHAGGRAAAVETKPALRSFTKADWSDLPQATADNLSIDEQVVLMSYQRDGYKGINQYLRNPTFSGSVFYQADAELLTQAVNRFATNKDVVVKRGVTSIAFGLDIPDSKSMMALKGKAFTDKGFISTAAFTNNGKVIGDSIFDLAYIQMTISVPKGTRGMAHNPLEAEFIMPPNTTLLITDVRIGNSGGYDIDAEVVSQ